MQVKNINQILKLRFELPEYHVSDWFEVHLYGKGILIRSGLRHADGETKSPYFYEESTWGKGHKKEAIRKFNVFLKEIENETRN